MYREKYMFMFFISIAIFHTKYNKLKDTTIIIKNDNNQIEYRSLDREKRNDSPF
jgi:hypothetical protein